MRSRHIRGTAPKLLAVASDRPVTVSVKAKRPPMTVPVLASASPPSCRSLTSSLGVTGSGPPTVTSLAPSNAVRSRVTLPVSKQGFVYVFDRETGESLGDPSAISPWKKSVR